jgi:hypothetical protein
MFEACQDRQPLVAIALGLSINRKGDFKVGVRTEKSRLRRGARAKAANTTSNDQ